MSTDFNMAEFVAVAYEIADCNEEGLTDPDEAIRIWTERTGGTLTEEDVKVITAAIKHEFSDQFGS